MEDAMVTARISSEKKAVGNAILERDGLNASQAVGLMYDRLEQEGSAEFLSKREVSPIAWQSAARLVDAIAAKEPVATRFDHMTRKQIKMERLKSKGLL